MKMKFDIAPTLSQSGSRHGEDEPHHSTANIEGPRATTTRRPRVEESIMYVIHTSEPVPVESSSSANTGQQPLYLPSRDDVGEAKEGDASGASMRQSTLILICCSLLLLRLLTTRR